MPPELVEQAQAAARPFHGRVRDRMRWSPADRPADATSLPFDELPERGPAWTASSMWSAESRNRRRSPVIVEIRDRAGAMAVSEPTFDTSDRCPQAPVARAPADVSAAEGRSGKNGRAVWVWRAAGLSVDLRADPNDQLTV
jgi:hypothetical protein